MLMDRIIKAFTFRKEVYADVEQDESFTSTAWMIVIVVSIVAAIGSFSFGNILGSLLGLVIGAVLNAVGFALGALVINAVGRLLFKAEVNFTELVRTLGLAYVWNVVNVIGILGGVLSCLLVPVRIVAWVGLVVSWFFAVKEALDLDWVPTIVTVVLGWIVIVIVQVVANLILGAMGVPGAAIF